MNFHRGHCCKTAMDTASPGQTSRTSSTAKAKRSTLLAMRNSSDKDWSMGVMAIRSPGDHRQTVAAVAPARRMNWIICFISTCAPRPHIPRASTRSRTRRPSGPQPTTPRRSSSQPALIPRKTSSLARSRRVAGSLPLYLKHRRRAAKPGRLSNRPASTGERPSPRKSGVCMDSRYPRPPARVMTSMARARPLNSNIGAMRRASRQVSKSVPAAAACKVSLLATSPSSQTLSAFGS